MTGPAMISAMKDRTGKFSGRHPLFAVACVAVCAVVAADWHWALGGLVALIGGGIGWFAGKPGRGIAWLACGLVAVGVFAVRNDGRLRAESGLVDTGGRYEAVILANAKGGPGRWSAPARISEGPWKGTRVQWEGSGDLPVAGSRVSGGGNFVELREPRNPEEFDEAQWLRRKGVAAVFRSRDNAVHTGPLAAFGAVVRTGFRTGVTEGLEGDSRQAKVIRAIVIGESPADADELVAAFRNSGTLHIFSVSGMHVAMVGGIAWFVLRQLRVSRRRAVLLILPLVFGYSWITGNSAPAVRSAWMMAVFLLAFSFRRQPDLLNALGAVLLAAVLWDGNLLFQPGVQMSYGVVAAIAVGTSWASRWFSWMAEKEEYLPDSLMTGWQARWLLWRKRLATSLGVSTAAWIGSTPLTIWHFGLVTPVALIGTLFLSIPVTLMLGAALFSASIHPLAPRAAGWLNMVNGKVADVCVVLAEGLSAIPGSHFTTKPSGEPMLVVYDLDYGSAAACFSGGREGAVLLDCGDPRAFRFRVARSLRGMGIEPDSVVISQPDGGHLGGASDVWEAFPIRQAWMPVEKARSPVFREWLRDGPAAGVRILKAGEVDDLPFPDGARLEVLHVPDPAAQNARASSRVAVFRLHWRGWKVLLTGDAGMMAEARMLASGRDLSADVIITGRHPSDPTLGAVFLDAVRPQAIIARHSDFPATERLDPRQVAFWESRGITVVHQGKTGGVTIRVDGDGDLLLEGYVDGSVVRLRR